MYDVVDIKFQQAALKHLGYYNGAIDGIWSIKSFEAKLAYERTKDFNPGVPSNGRPFNVNARLPAALSVTRSGYLTIAGVDLEALYFPTVREIKGAQPLPSTPPTPAPQQPPASREFKDAKDKKGNNQPAQAPATPPTATTAPATPEPVATEINVKLSDLK